jgi:ribosomal protein S18 acetylase RimI-like enzyme
LEFSDPRLNPAHDLRLWEDADGQLAGFGQLWIMQEGEVVDGYLYFRIHPDARDGDIESEVIAWSSEQLSAVGRARGAPAKLYSVSPDYYTYGRSIPERHGFTPVRYSYTMGRSLDEPVPAPQFPEGFVLRHVASEEDVVRWVNLFNQSFIDHWNHHPLTVEAHRHWLTTPNYRPEHDLVAVAPDGTFAALCFCAIDPADNARNRRNDGWINTLGTRRGFRRIGLGRAMLLAGLRRLKEDGAATAKLGVDAQNPTGALRLYESAGFQKLQTRVSYVKEV